MSLELSPIKPVGPACPKCGHVRNTHDPKDQETPHWQCPACGVAYAKVGETPERPRGPDSPVVSSSRMVLPSGKVLLVLMVLFGGLHWLFTGSVKESGNYIPIPAHLDTAAIACEHAPQAQVVMLTTAWCPYCEKARRHLAKNRIDYCEHDVEVTRRGEVLWEQLGRPGVPVIFIGREMIRGFSPGQISAALVRQ